MKQSRASPERMLVVNLVFAFAFVLGFAFATSVPPAVASTNGVARMTESPMSVPPSIYYVDSTADTPLSIAAPFADDAAEHNPTDEVEVLAVGKVDFGATAMKIWFVPDGRSTSSSPAPPALATTSTGMTGTLVDTGRVSRGVGEMAGAASLATRTQFG